VQWGVFLGLCLAAHSWMGARIARFDSAVIHSCLLSWAILSITRHPCNSCQWHSTPAMCSNWLAAALLLSWVLMDVGTCSVTLLLLPLLLL